MLDHSEGRSLALDILTGGRPGGGPYAVTIHSGPHWVTEREYTCSVTLRGYESTPDDGIDQEYPLLWEGQVHPSAITAAAVRS